MGLSHPLDCNVYLVDTGSGLIMVDPGWGWTMNSFKIAWWKWGMIHPV